MKPEETLIAEFRAAAEKVSAIVSEVGSMEEALAYVVGICERKEHCQRLMPGCGAPLSDESENRRDRQPPKSIAAPLLSDEEHVSLESLCRAGGIALVRENLRDHAAGIDIGLTMADFGIAETGTLVIDSSSEDIRLTTMISELHVAVLPQNRIRRSVFELENDLAKRMAAAPDYTAFITGASRTADIERVLALGVHGPLELHILLLSP